MGGKVKVRDPFTARIRTVPGRTPLKVARAVLSTGLYAWVIHGVVEIERRDTTELIIVNGVTITRRQAGCKYGR